MRYIKSISKNIIATALLGFFIAMNLGCSKGNTKQYQPSYDEGKANKMTQPGTNQILGSALMKKPFHGEIVTCAGNQVYAIPVTEASSYWIRENFINNGETTRDGSSGYYETGDTSSIDADPDERFMKHVLTSVCDVQGRFTFRNVADGEFYIVTKVSWTIPSQVAGYLDKGGALMKKIDVMGGKTTEIVLAPPQED